MRILVELQKQTAFQKQIATDIHSIWEQIDDTPVGFKIHERKL